MIKKIAVVLAILLSVFPILKVSAQTNAGFVPSNIWYSKDPFEEGDKIQIYTLVFNPDTRELSGTVSFFDKNVLLGKKNITVPAKGVKDLSINWTVTAGNHTIFAKLENAKFLTATGKYEDVYLAENQTDNSERTVSKKIIPKEKSTAETATDSAIVEKVDNALNSIEQTISDSTPKVVSVPILATANAIENVRESLSASSDAKKAEVKEKIATINKDASAKDAEKPSPILKPLKYAELFLLTLAALIFGHKVIFYGILLVIFFYLLRYIYRLVF